MLWFEGKNWSENRPVFALFFAGLYRWIGGAKLVFGMSPFFLAVAELAGSSEVAGIKEGALTLNLNGVCGSG